MQYTLEEIRNIYNLPFNTLLYIAQGEHQKHQKANAIKLCSARSIKTGACPEDCAFCPQSVHYSTSVKAQGVLDLEEALKCAKAAKENGASRFCMGGAWGSVPKGKSFEKILKIVGEVSNLGLEVCCSMGTFDNEQIEDLKQAGCSVVNYNLDTSKDYYDKVITTRTYEERLENLKRIQGTGMQVCCGGIIGLGESIDDRIKLLHELANLDPQPESVPLNALQPIKGTPLGERNTVDPFEFVRTVATARICMPRSIIALGAGRVLMSDELQSLCFLAGANSIILGDKILTVENPTIEEDFSLMERLGLVPMDEKEEVTA